MLIAGATKTSKAPGSSVRRLHLLAGGFWLISLAVFWGPATRLASLSLHDERSTHILLIPIISGFLLFLDHKKIFRSSRPSVTLGVLILLVSAVLWFLLKPSLGHLSEVDLLSVTASLIYLVWLAGFVMVYGAATLKAAAFPMIFLGLIIPIPIALADGLVSFLQRESAATCYFLFQLLGVPFIRHGFQFSLPGVDIEVAEQCSGIHSALALLIVGLLMQHFLLCRKWEKAVFILMILPVAIFKNAVRIVTIAWLGIHVNPEFFHGQLHRQGGLPFAVLAVALLGVLLWGLRKLAPASRERKTSATVPVAAG